MDNSLNWPLFKSRLTEATLALPHFLRHPIHGMRALPDWPWLEILVLQAIFAAVCAALGNAVAHHYLGIAIGLFLGPIVNFVVYGITAGFFYYVMQLWFRSPATYREVYLNVAFSAIPTMLTNIVVPLFPAALPIGVAASLALLYVGLSSNFKLNRKHLRVLLLALMIIYGGLWAWGLITTKHRRDSLRVRATPESLDILEQELGTSPGEEDPAEPEEEK